MRCESCSRRLFPFFMHFLQWFKLTMKGMLVLHILMCGFAWGATYPSGFQETVVFSGLSRPTAVRFAPDGRVFVAEKSGLIKVFNGLSDTTPDIFADLRTNVYDYWDRGLLGLALDPQFPAQPYVYVLYTYDAEIGGTAPRWNDTCPTPPGDTNDGCMVSGRLSRLQISPNNTLVGGEQVLITNNWCQQYPSHSIGDLYFGPEGALYVSAGDGASFGFTDYGQGGGDTNSPTPFNPCGDPPVPVGVTQTPPTAEGGALRSQDIQTTADPATLDGSILRVNPTTGAAWPDNPLTGGADRIIGYGLRNPFRFTIKPGTDQVWIGDVGWNTWEEINKLNDANDSIVENFGWPCYEGNVHQSSYDATNLNICLNLYNQSPGATAPFYAYRHDQLVDPDPGQDGCRTGSSSISGLAFYQNGVYPGIYQQALFFADYSRDCIYVIRADGNGNLDLATRTSFGVNSNDPVDLEAGPGGDLYYVDHGGGAIKRIIYSAVNQIPTAVIQANPTSGIAPLTVQFDGSGSFDPDPGATLFYQWDLDGDSQYDDATIVNPAYTYTANGQYTVRLKVTDDDGASDTEQVVITVGNTPPTATVTAPQSTFTWHTGETINFAGTGTDPQDGQIPAASFHWDIILHHCPGGTSDCHDHNIQQIDDVKQGSITGYDHEWLTRIEIKLTVTDSGGLTDQDSVTIDPETVTFSFQSTPSGLILSMGGVDTVTPFSRLAIIGSTNTLSAPSPQTLNGTQYSWMSWSDGGLQSHTVIAGQTSASFSAQYSSSCSYQISPNHASFPSNGGTGTVNVTAPAGCTWTAVSQDNWITVTSGANGSGSGVVSYSVASNPTTRKRNGKITIAGINFRVQQDRR